MAERIETVVAGAGVIGLAVARRLAMAGRDVVVLEAADAIGTGTSSRNSEVVHAGLYYPEGSLRARLCIAGKQALYRYCADHGVAAPKVQKLLVAVEDNEIPGLRKIEASARAAGVDDLRRLSADEARRLEPALRCTEALLSPSTGIVDSHGLMLALQGDAEERGAAIAFNSPVTGGAVETGEIAIDVGGAQPMQIRCREFVNAAGLKAQDVATSIRGVDPATVPPVHYAKGSYFVLAGKSPFTHLIYPAPAPKNAGWLGVHVTLDLGGRARFGPDMEWTDRIDYRVDPRRAAPFYAAVRRYWPDLENGALEPGYAGVRPKLSRPGEPIADFVIDGPEDHGIPGVVNLFGIDSPGLTSSLAIADHVGRKLGLPPDPLFAAPAT